MENYHHHLTMYDVWNFTKNSNSTSRHSKKENVKNDIKILSGD